MEKCCVCGMNAPHDSERIGVGVLKKKYLPMCEKCAGQLKILETAGLNAREYAEANRYFEENKPKNSSGGIGLHIKLCNLKRNIKGKIARGKVSRGKVYYVDKMPISKFDNFPGKHIHGVDINIPKRCTNCMKETDKTETTYARAAVRDGNRKNVRTLEIEFPICDECRFSRERPSVKIAALTVGFASYGLMFTNEEYAKLFCEMNNKTYSVFEDDGLISAMD